MPTNKLVITTQLATESAIIQWKNLYKKVKENFNAPIKVNIDETWLKEEWDKLSKILETSSAGVQKYAIDTWVALDNIKFTKLENWIVSAQKQLIEARKQLALFKGDTTKVWFDAAQKSVNKFTKSVTLAKSKFNNFTATWDENMSRFKKVITSTNTWMTELWKTFKKIFSFTLAFTAIAKLKQAITWAWDASVQFESSLAGVDKTLNLTTQELAWMDRQLEKLSATIPLTYEELAKIAEIWGQLWIAKEEIIDFTKTMAELRATTDLTSDDAILNFAKFNNVMWSTWEAVRDNANAIVALGNNSATTESQILTFWQRVNTAWKLAWISATQVLAIGTAFSSAWIKAEAWWTAVSATIWEIDKAVQIWWEQLDAFAAVVWTTAEDFATRWRNDAWIAFSDFLKGLEKSWNEWVQVLDELWLSNSRTVRALLATANSSLDLEAALDLANKSLEDHNALEVEFQKRADTTESKLIIQNNQWRLLWDYLADDFKETLLDIWDLLLDISTKAVSTLSKLKILIKEAWANTSQFINAQESQRKIFQLTEQSTKALKEWRNDEFIAIWKQIDQEKLLVKLEEERVNKSQALTYKKILAVDEELSVVADAEKIKNDIVDAEIENKITANKEILSDLKDALWEEAEAKAKAAETASKELIAENKKRKTALSAIDKQLNKDKETWSIDYNKLQIKLLKERLSDVKWLIEKSTWDELDLNIDLSNDIVDNIKDRYSSMSDAISDYNQNVEDSVDKIQDFYDDVVEWAEEAADKVTKLTEEIDDLKDVINWKDIDIAERRIELLEEEKELLKDKKSLEEEFLWISSFKSVNIWGGAKSDIYSTSWEVDLEWSNILEYQEILSSLADTQAELNENTGLLNQELFDQASAYDALTESWKINADYQEEVKDLLDEQNISTEWNIDLKEILKGKEEDLNTLKEESLNLIEKQKTLEQNLTWIIEIEIDKRVTSIDVYIERAEKLVKLLNEANIIEKSDLNTVDSTWNSNTIINQTNTYTVNDATDPIKVWKIVSKYTQDAKNWLF